MLPTKMWTLHKKCGSLDLRRVFVLILFVATFSFLTSYQLGQTVIVIKPRESGNGVQASHDRDPLGMVVGSRNFGRSLNMHGASNEKVESKPASLISRLLKLEESLVEETRQRKIGLVGLSDTAAAEALPRLQGLAAAHGQTFEHVRDIRPGNEEIVIQGNYSMILCAGESDACPDNVLSPLGAKRRMNRMLVIEREISDPRKLCELSRAILRHEEKYDRQHEQPCHIFSDKTENFGASSKTVYPVIVAYEHKSSVTVLYNATTELVSERWSRNDSTTLWVFNTSPMVHQSGPMLRLELLITSYRPLRLYMFPKVASGHLDVLSRPYLYSKQVTLDDILQNIGENYGLSASNHWWNTIQKLLLKIFVSAEFYSQKVVNSQRCMRCFEIYSVDVICASVKQCYIIQTKPILFDLISREDLLVPVLQLLTSQKMGSLDISNALETMAKSLDMKHCEEAALCLSDEVLVYLLEDRRETLDHTELIKIYPTPSSSIFTPFLSNLKALSAIEDQQKTTYEIHDFLMNLEAYYARQESAVPDQFDVSDEVEMYGTESDFDYHDTLSPNKGMRTENGCTKDPTFFAELSGITTDPAVQLHQYSHDEFHATVDYETIVIKVWATARHCCCEVRLGDILEPKRPTNFTLGLGDNIIRLLLVDITRREHKIIRTIKLHLFRESRGLLETMPDTEALKTCSLRQDCSLPFSHSVPCGLRERNITWRQFQRQQKPDCMNGDITGSWVVPCRDCKFDKSCYWNNAKWQPGSCNYRRFSDGNICKCLEDRNILFLGDSTNRGIMHYLIERINGSLYAMDKTHTLKVYPNLNEARTNMTFAYYPHFWLPAKHRPKFHKVLYQLIRRSLPLANNSSTVLMVGGVHWLAKRHIDIILSALRRTGLSNITKVVKGLGAGFHQNINGVRFVNKEDQVKLLVREREVLNYAKDHDFHVVGTFNMTMARYKDFTQGKCACHFHKVSKRTDNHEQRYTVEGDINAEYSQILLHNICDIS